MSDDQFTKLFKYMEQRFDGVDEGFEVVDKRFDNLTNLIDGYVAKLDTYAAEMAAMQHKIDRLEKYIYVLADKAGIDLDKVHI